MSSTLKLMSKRNIFSLSEGANRNPWRKISRIDKHKVSAPAESLANLQNGLKLVTRKRLQQQQKLKTIWINQKYKFSQEIA